MKKLCNASAIAAFLTAVCFTAVSCNKTPSESTLPVEKELGVSIELTSATETSVSVDITAEKDAEGYIYAIGEAGKLNEFQNGTMEGIQTQNDPTVKSASFDGLTPPPPCRRRPTIPSTHKPSQEKKRGTSGSWS